VDLRDRCVADARRRRLEPNLVERQQLLDFDRERARYDLEVELAVVAGADLVEAIVAVGEDAREDIEPAGRALGFAFARTCCGRRSSSTSGIR